MSGHVMFGRPADPDAYLSRLRQAGLPPLRMEPHPGSAPAGGCAACGVALMIGPKQQAKAAELTAAGTPPTVLCPIHAAALVKDTGAAMNVLPDKGA